MKIRITIELDNLARRAFGYQGLVDGMASHDEIQRHLEAVIDTLIDDVVSDYERHLHLDDDATPDAG